MPHPVGLLGRLLLGKAVDGAAAQDEVHRVDADHGAVGSLLPEWSRLRG